jgi:hypothetical protein
MEYNNLKLKKKIYIGKYVFSSIYGKALGQVVRICGIIKIINMLCEMKDVILEEDVVIEKYLDQKGIDKKIKKV